MAMSVMRPLPSGRVGRSPSSRVCRSLFGPVDHEETDRILNEESRRHAEEDKRRWNFDFDTDTPLPGRYDWQFSLVSPSSASFLPAAAQPTAATAATTPRLATPVALRLTINHHSLSSEGEEDTEPDTPGSNASSADDSDDYCEFESPLDRCIRRHTYDLRSLHPASSPATVDDIANNDNVVAIYPNNNHDNNHNGTNTHAHHEDHHACAPIRLDPITHRSRSPLDINNSSSQQRQTKITDFLRQRKRKLSSGFGAESLLNKKILRGSPFRAPAAAPANAAIAVSTAGSSGEAAATSSTVQ